MENLPHFSPDNPDNTDGKEVASDPAESCSEDPIGNITEADMEILKTKEISPKEYEEMWTLPARIKMAKEKCLTEYDD